MTGRRRCSSQRRATATCTGSTICPRGQLDTTAVPSPGSVSDGLVQTLEFQPAPAIRQMLATQGTVIPATGRGSIAYVIAAYNNGDFQTMRIGGVDRQVFGFEWGYQGACPTTQKCGPIASGVVHFNANACFAVRTDQGQSPTYTLRCLSGPTVNPVGAGLEAHPLRAGLRLHPEHRALTVRRRPDLLRRLRLQLLPRRRHGMGGNVPAQLPPPFRFSERKTIMKRQTRSPRRRGAVAMASGGVAVLALMLSACGSSPSQPAASPERVSGGSTGHYVVASGIHKIKHIIVIEQENRSFDSYFGTYPGADGIPRTNGVPTVCVPVPTGGCQAPYHDTADVNGGGPHDEGECDA